MGTGREGEGTGCTCVMRVTRGTYQQVKRWAGKVGVGELWSVGTCVRVYQLSTLH